MPDLEGFRPTMALHFVERDGKRILRQLWINMETREDKWIDVPFLGTEEEGE